MKKNLSSISDQMDALTSRQKEQEDLLKELREQHQKTVNEQFAKLKQDLKDELKKEVNGVFASMWAELSYLLALVRDSYVHVIYDISTRLGFEKKDVDSLFATVSGIFSDLWQSTQNLFALS